MGKKKTKSLSSSQLAAKRGKFIDSEGRLRKIIIPPKSAKGTRALAFNRGFFIDDKGRRRQLPTHLRRTN